jgi:hypothetical protein
MTIFVFVRVILFYVVSETAHGQLVHHLPLFYCQTFENRSSPPNPPADLDVLVVAAGVVLLVQPPNSSSAATLGAKPPDAPGTMGLLASESHPKSFDVVVGLGGSGLSLGASGVAHAFPPQTSALDKLFVPSEPMEPSGLDVVVELAVREDALG